jgi:hypothetical protein
MKTIIAISGTANTGKSSSVIEVDKMADAKYPGCLKTPLVRQGNLLFETITYKGKILGLDEQGDPSTGLLGRLTTLATVPCDAIICTCRTSGQTVTDVKSVATTYGYDVVWTAPYQDEKTPHRPILNQYKAEHLVDLMDKLGVFP